VKGCDGTVADGENVDTASAGQKSFEVTATDEAGNGAILARSCAVSEAAPPSDTQAPTVVGVTPANGSAGVSRSANVTAAFSGEMDPSTLTAKTVKLVRVGKRGKETPVTNVRVSCNDPCTTVTLDRPSTSARPRSTGSPS